MWYQCASFGQEIFENKKECNIEVKMQHLINFVPIELTNVSCKKKKKRKHSKMMLLSLKERVMVPVISI